MSDTKRVTLSIPRARHGEAETLFVGINGVNYLIPKGKTVEVPPEVAAEVERSQQAEIYMHDASESLKKQEPDGR